MTGPLLLFYLCLCIGAVVLRRVLKHFKLL